MTSPCIQVYDIDTTLNWYNHFLGFECTYRSKIKEPEFAILEKSGSKIFVHKSQNNDVYASNIFVIETPDLNKEFEELSQKGVIIVQQISDGVFGAQEFVAKDYEDNKIIYRESV